LASEAKGLIELNEKSKKSSANEALSVTEKAKKCPLLGIKWRRVILGGLIASSISQFQHFVLRKNGKLGDQ